MKIWYNNFKKSAVLNYTLFEISCVPTIDVTRHKYLGTALSNLTF